MSSSLTVYIWRGTSSNTGQGSSVPSFGHVSIETKLGDISRYISFWPGNCNTTCCRQNQPHYHSKDIDLIYEGRAPDAVYTLNNLNIPKINDWFDRHKNDFSWGLRGSSIFQGPNEFNCAGLTLQLLKKGGIHQTLSTSLENVRRKIAAICSSCFIFAPLCAWSAYLIRPLSKFPSIYSACSLAYMTSFEQQLLLANNLKCIHNSILSAESALVNLYHKELIDHPEIQQAILPDIENLKEHTFTYFEPLSNFGLGILSKSLKDALMEDFSKYSIISKSGSFAALSAFILGTSVYLLNYKAVSSTATPSDIESLICNALYEKKNKNGRSFKTALNWIVCASGVAAVSVYFFKEVFSWFSTLKITLNENFLITNKI